MLTIITEATTFDLTTLDVVKSELGVTNGDNDANLIRWIHEASEIVATYCNRVFGLETVEETFRNTWGKSELILSRFPVTEIVTFTADDVLLTQDEDFEVDVDAGLVYRLLDDLRETWDADKVVIRYSAGYDLIGTLPRDLERAAIELVKLQFFSSRRDPLARSVDIPGVMSKSYWVGSVGDNGALPPNITALLDPFRRGDKGLTSC